MEERNTGFVFVFEAFTESQGAIAIFEEERSKREEKTSSSFCTAKYITIFVRGLEYLSNSSIKNAMSEYIDDATRANVPLEIKEVSFKTKSSWY